MFTDYGVSSLTVSCDYGYPGDGEENLYTVVCEVNGESNEDCEYPAVIQ